MDSFLSQIILEKVPIQSIVRRYNPEMREGAALVRCINPGHNDSCPSMKLYPKTNSCYCFGCGFSGNPISVVSKLENVSLIQAMQLIKKWFSIEEDFTQLSLKEVSNVKRLKQEFDRTFDFYQKQFIKFEYLLTPEDLSILEDIYITSDLQQLKKFYEEKKQSFRRNNNSSNLF